MTAESLILFAKPPLAGRVKTRLAASLGDEGTARLYACFLRDAAETAFRLYEARPDVSLICEWVLGRCESLHDFPLADWLPGPFLHRAQSGADLGARMSAALGRCMTSGGHAVLIGTDFPDLPHDVLKEAFEKLESENAPALAIGPAADGGYYLIGMRRFLPEIFTGIPWSTSEVLSCTITRSETLGIGAALLPEWRDVDNPNDLEALEDRLSQSASPARHTREYLS